MNYSIENCPCFLQDGKCNIWANSDEVCTNNPNCIIKQIHESCKAASEFCKECSKEAIYQIDCIECTKGGKAEMANIILNMLEAKEIS